MTEPLQLGQRLGAYRIIRSLGGGGMGQVHEAEHVSLGVRRALKVFTTESHHIDFLRKRFIAEGRILADLDHPRIVHVYDLVVDDETGTPYFAMDLVLSPNGTPRTLENEREAGVSEEKVAMWFKDICEGLAYIHSHKVVHRDISLDNILIGPDGHAVISDFGIAKIVDDNYRRKINVTVTMASKDAKDLCMGKGNYMAPELKRGGKETPASDAYALGVLLFRLLTGFWYEPNKPEKTKDLLSACEYNWDDVIGKLCNFTPKMRLSENGISEVPLCLRVKQLTSPLWRKKWLWGMLGVCVLVVAMGGFFSLKTFYRGKHIESAEKVLRREIELNKSGNKVPPKPDGDGALQELLDDLAAGVSNRTAARRKVKFATVKDESGVERKWRYSEINGGVCILGLVNATDKGRHDDVSQIDIPAEIAGVKTIAIGEDAFLFYRNLSKVVIPNGVVWIGERAFSICRKLNDVSLPATLKRIGVRAFDECSALTEIKLPNSLEMIGAEAFSSTALVTVEVPDFVARMDERAFRGCNKLRFVRLGGSLAEISSELFANCSELKEIVIPANVKTIGARSFEGCSSLKEVRLLEGVSNLREEVFSGCRSLQRIFIPKSVIQIEGGFFNGCEKLEKVVFEGDMPVVKDLNSGEGLYPREINDVTTYVKLGTSGWPDQIPGIWQGRPIAYIKDTDERKGASSQGSPMYSADGKSLVRVPNDLQELVIPEGVLHVTNNVFPRLKGRKKYQLKKVVIPSTLPFKDNEKFEDFIRAAVGRGCREFVVSVSNRCYRMDGENFMMTCDGRRIFCFVPTTEDCRIPEGVERIDAHWPNFKTICLPSTFRYSRERFPSGASISVSDRNDNFVVKDGKMLISRDGKRIEQYTGRDKVFVVDEGVEEIFPNAYENIKRDVGIVVLPRSLRKLCKYFRLNIFSDHIGSLQAICFRGDAPEANYDIFGETIRELRVYVTKGSRGWFDAEGDLRKKWPKEDKYGRSLLYWDGVHVPTPDDKLACQIADANLALSLTDDAFLRDDWSAASELFDAVFHGDNEILLKEWDLGAKESFLMEMMAKAEVSGDTMCMFLLGWWFERGGMKDVSKEAQNPKMAVNWYQRGAYKGDGWCMAKLGDCYARGFGVTQDREAAFKYYTKAAEMGLSIGMSGLGDCYFNGIGTLTNREEAVKWYLKAAEKNNNHWDRGETAERIAQCFKEGIGVAKDLTKAREWDERSKNEKQKRMMPFVSTNRVETAK